MEESQPEQEAKIDSGDILDMAHIMFPDDEGKRAGFIAGFISGYNTKGSVLQPKQEAIENEDEIIDELYAYLKPGEDITCKNSPITTKHLREMFVITRRK